MQLPTVLVPPPVTPGTCPVCHEAVRFAAGRGYCAECAITFPQPRKTRAELVSAFLPTFYLSKASGTYHRAGCKYLKSINPENLIVVHEPYGKPCVCVSRR